MEKETLEEALEGCKIEIIGEKVCLPKEHAKNIMSLIRQVSTTEMGISKKDKEVYNELRKIFPEEPEL